MTFYECRVRFREICDHPRQPLKMSVSFTPVSSLEFAYRSKPSRFSESSMLTSRKAGSNAEDLLKNLSNSWICCRSRRPLSMASSWRVNSARQFLFFKSSRMSRRRYSPWYLKDESAHCISAGSGSDPHRYLSKRSHKKSIPSEKISILNACKGLIMSPSGSHSGAFHGRDLGTRTRSSART